MRNRFFVVAACFVAITPLLVLGGAKSPSEREIKRKQGELRSSHNDAERVYAKLAPKPAATPEYWSKREKELQTLLSRMGLPSIPKYATQAGPSLMWRQRVRVAPLPAVSARDYSVGPNGAVVPFSGEFTDSASEISGISRGGVGFSLERQYASFSNYDCGFGVGWNFNYNAGIIVAGENLDSAQALTFFIGSRDIRFENRDGRWMPEPGMFLRFEYDGKRIMVYAPDLLRYEFEPAAEQVSGIQRWRLAAMASRHDQYRANRLEITYLSKCDRIAYITDPSGQKFSFAYDAAGHIVQVANDREFVNFDYDASGKLLIRVRYMPSKLSLTEEFAPEISYQYTAGDEPLLKQKSSSALKYAVEVEYDANRRVQKAGFVAKDQQQMWAFEYLPNKVTLVKSPQPTPDSRYSFAGAPHPSLPSSIEIPAQQATWQYKFNADLMLASITEPLGNRKERTYDSGNPDVLMHGNLLEEKQFPATGCPADLKSFGHRTKYHKQIALPVEIDYYQVGNDGKETVLKREHFEYSEGDFLLTCHNNGGIKQYTAYNRFGLPVLEWDANKNVTISYYAESLPNRYCFDFVDGDVKNGGPLVRTIQDADDAEIEAACNAVGCKEISRGKFNRVPPRALEPRTAYDPYGNKIHTKSGFDESFSIFTGNGKLLVSCDAETGLTEYQYYKSGRTDRIYHEFFPGKNQSYQGGLFLNFADSRYYPETFRYDSLDMLAEHQLTDERFDGNAPVYRYVRHPNGKVKKITNPMGVSRIDEYDPQTGRLQKQLLTGGEQSITLTSNYEYYTGGQVKSYIDQFGGRNAFELDGFGRVFAATDSKGVVTRQIRDGLDRVIEKTASCDGKILTREAFLYSAQNQKLEAKKVWQINGDKSIELETARYIYDDAGNLIAKRGVRKDSWQYFLIDGCGDTVAELTPEGDVSVSVQRYGKPMYSVSFLREKDGEPVKLGTLTQYDFAGRAVKNTPVDSNDKPVEARDETFSYNTIGQKTETTSQHLTSSAVVYNSLGKVIREEIKPLSTNFGEAPHVTTSEYRADGQMKRREFGNRALALRGQKENVKPELVDAPQITVFEYDALGRMVRTIDPDGLISGKTYNEHSLPIEIKWTHVAEPEKTLRHLRLEYNVTSEVTSITDGNTNKLLRKYEYDKLGNCIEAVDHSNPQPVRLERRFDSIGNMTKEKVGYGDLKLPWSHFEYDLLQGESTAKWESLPITSGMYWCSETRHADRAGRIVGISLDEKQFVNWSYLGSQCAKREIPDSRLWQQNYFTSLMELRRTELKERDNIIGRFEYDYGPQGQPVYAATALGDKYKFAAYSQFDVYRRLVGQNGEAVVPASLEEAERRHIKIFGDGKDAVAAVNTSRMIYDQANNIWGRYSGAQLPNVTPLDLKKDRLQHFSSPANVISGDSSVPDLALRELASNREAAIASYAGDWNLKATEFKYDRLGNLIEFEGSFWNGNRRYPVKWNLTFDPLGRLSGMKATALEDMGVVKKDDQVAELSFVYDAENRRLLKQVTDRTRIGGEVMVHSEITLFRGNQQTLVFDLKENNELKLIGEYLWGATERELLMAALPEYQAEKQGEYKIGRYFFQQDKGLNIVFTSKVENGTLIPVAAESYLGFGDNSTFAEIADIQSSMRGSNAENAHNRRLDEELGASWGNPGGMQYLEIQLSDESKLAQLTIWAEKFPKDFYVFVLSKDASRDYASNLGTWINTKENIEKYFAATVTNSKFGDTVMGEALTSPYRLPLRELNGNRILLVFDDSRQHDINVREFEVVKVADNPSPIAFAGQWMDRETGMYYQINRYRLSGSDKFISPDPIGFMDGNNLYAYAKGNPLEWHDPDGRWGHILVGAGIGAVFGGGGYLLNCWLTGAEFSWAEFGIQTTIGALSGAVGAATFGVGSFGLHGWQGAVLAGVTSGGAAGATAGGLDAGIHSAMAGNSIGETLSKTAWGAFKGGVTGAIAGGVASGTIQALNVKPVQDVINRGLAIFRYSTGVHITRRTVKGFLNAGLAGFMGGGSAGATSGVFHGIETGDWSTIASRTGRGMLQGTAGALLVHTALSSAERVADKTWDKDRASYWKQEAKNNPSGYSEADLARMRTGAAPQRINPTTGRVESMELHHDLIPQRSGLPKTLINQRWNLRKVWPDEHRAIDVYR